ncbi:hypothetical protein K437DRAFT_251083 [Tilletiaria anomala UBC 951]|uniref:Nudix hydrolase domain-containing protein n=1 Tax=Tilletiaria anomala (strain ATCC 24038 / CBS 436.72 / UBC 951) TaxID=1037660 RepID=A0A066VJ75_TILAU|nr:uncharacterized protein K437DRAFT_251083 [Tilletiaria anomala UBC 951]KDN38779.1 hypothetical protein K437DRAFT_251083 [Tilletiaria anomala UBC 951]
MPWTIQSDLQDLGLFDNEDSLLQVKPDATVMLNFSGRTEKERTQQIGQLVQKLREGGRFPSLDGWRDELYAIYGPERCGLQQQREILFKMERSACSLFGFATFGVHCTGYTEDMKVWVPRRSKTKSTFPGMLDNTVAGNSSLILFASPSVGGITAGESPFESMVRECGEEAGLEDAFVRSGLRSTGAISYFYKNHQGLTQPEVEYTYEILLPSKVIPAPVDGEAEYFTLMSFEEAMQRMRNFEFKPNCALVLIDFYIRHGLITPDNEPDYLQILTLIHTDLKLPGP